MSFYGQKGDFYTGRTGYYRGDPGFLSGFLGDVANIVKRQVVPTVAGYITGGPVGAAAALAGSAIKKTAQVVTSHPVISAAAAAGAGTATELAVRHALGGKTGRLAMTGSTMTLPGTLAARGGGGGRVIGIRRRRRMNVCNPRALRRAIRRTHGFARLAMKTIHIVHPKKKGHFGGFKKRRKR
jgi:hypothetical protein